MRERTQLPESYSSIACFLVDSLGRGPVGSSLRKKPAARGPVAGQSKSPCLVALMG